MDETAKRQMVRMNSEHGDAAYNAGQAKAYRECADELAEALPDLLYALGEYVSIKGLLADADLDGLTAYLQVETLLAQVGAEARTGGGWQAKIRDRITTLRGRISSREFREAPGGNFVITSDHADGMLDEIEELLGDPLPSAPTETK